MKLLTNLGQRGQQLLRRRWQTLLRKHAAYLSSRGWHYWQDMQHPLWSDGQPTQRAAKIVVLSRQFYREFVKDYPITNKADLAAVLANEFMGKKVFHLYTALPEQGFRVTSYELQPEALTQLKHYCLLLPESWLIQHATTQDQLIQLSHRWGQYFVYKHGNRSGSQLKTALCTSPESVLHLHGLPELLTVQLYDEAASCSLLWSSLSQHFSLQAANFSFAGQSNLSALPWRWLAGSLAGILLLYYTAAALFIGYQERQTLAALAAMGPEVQQLLDQQAEAEQLKSQLTTLSSQLAAIQPAYPVWQLIQQLLSQHVQVRSLQVNLQKVELSGEAERATDVLQMLKRMPGVTAVEFSAPTRRDRGLDMFTISLQLAGLTTAVPAAQPSEPTLAPDARLSNE